MTQPSLPGEILLEKYLKPMGISQNAMARAIGVPPRAVNEIVLGRRSVTPAMSIRFGVFFNQPDNFWSNLQLESDLHALAKGRPRLISKIQPASNLVKSEAKSPPAHTENPTPSGSFFQLPVENL